MNPIRFAEFTKALARTTSRRQALLLIVATLAATALPGCASSCSSDSDCSGSETCVNGTCSSSGCSGSQTSCSGSCVDTSSDSNNCGSCGNGCSSGQSCLNGSCSSSSSSSGG